MAKARFHLLACAAVSAALAVVAFPAAAQEQPPAPATAASDPALPPELPDSGAEQTKTSEEIIEQRKGSLMFNSHDLQLFYDAVGGSTIVAAPLETGEPGETPSPAPDKEAGPQPIERPNFRLNSIVYFNGESWSVWLNDWRIRNHNPSPDEAITVQEAHESTITFTWKTPYLDTIAPNWKVDFIPFKDVEKPEHNTAHHWNYASADGKILVNSMTGTVQVELGLYQTFVSSTMKIAEGVVAPVPPIMPEEKGTTVSAEGNAPHNSWRRGPNQDPESASEKTSEKGTPGKGTQGDAKMPGAPSGEQQDLDALVQDVFKN